MEYMYDLRIPKERVAVLIGKNGEIKKNIEKATKTEINVDSDEGEIFITGDDTLGLYTAKEIVRAIGRGFNPEYASLLLKVDYGFEVFNINEFSGKSKNNAMRLKGRVIGKEGKARRLIEELTGTHICVYGKTIAIIGKIEDIATARRAVENLLSGSPHSNVYRWLEKKRNDRNRDQNMGENIGEIIGSEI